MATTGSTGFGDAADKIGAQNNDIPQDMVRKLRLANALMPYLFDAFTAMVSRTGEYQGGNTMKPLDMAVLCSAYFAANAK